MEGLAEPPSRGCHRIPKCDSKPNTTAEKPKTQPLSQRPGSHACPAVRWKQPACDQSSALWKLVLSSAAHHRRCFGLDFFQLSPRANPLCALPPTLTTDQHSACLVQRDCCRLSRRKRGRITKETPIPTLDFLVSRPSNAKQTRQTPNTCKIRQLWSKNTNESSAMSLGL
ncbi:hypothetical protein BKA80DRAFT_31932 [Phyllosticta citrichinensis]